ncbi:MAG TPA: Fe-S cluster assembly protein SufD [Tepidisphaeraceae bacterium]|nr:Fe-S cluster assembly protein SufD [Tepidisphaeraceae bacterium]
MAEKQSAQASHFLRLSAQSIDGGPSWLNDLRKAGLARFDRVGFPNTKQEEWRHTNVAPIARIAFKPGEIATPDEATQFSFGQDAVCELVFINGHFSQKLSRLGKLPRGVAVRSLAEARDLPELHGVLGQHASINANPFVALNTAFLSDGAYIHLAKNTTLQGPIHLLFFSTEQNEPTVSHPRVLVVAEDNVEAQIVESYVGTSGRYFTNAVTEIVLGNDCRIDHCKLQQESLDAFHVASMQVKLGRATTFVSHAASIGAKLSRNDLNCLMDGEGAYATLNGLVLLKDEQHCDNHTLLDHAQPNCPSHELYKHVLAGKSTGVFRGKILVRQPAQKTDSKQNSKSLLLSDDAYMNSQPALEIYADDVKCTHGSTTGPVDEDMVFYLQTRGVGLEAARHLLTYAFAADVTRRMRVEPVRRRIEDYMAIQHGLPQDLRITDLGMFDEKAR